MHNVSRRAVIGATGFLATVGPRGVFAADIGTRVALKGYDPVSYFTAGKPEKGSAEFAASYDNATYWFKDAERRALFVADPDRFAPQYDGFCTINVSRGVKYEADPEAWVIADGKLYVFGDKAGVPRFRKEGAGIVTQANANWPGLRGR